MTPSRWLELRVRVRDVGARDLLADALLALGGTAVEERGDTLVTHVPEPGDTERFLRAADSRIREAAPGAAGSLEGRWRNDRDWIRTWRAALRPRRVGRRFVVAPPWTTPEHGEDDVVLAIDPGMAFGTGEHATTRGMLRLLERAIRPGDRLLDVGTGSGILAIAAARLGAAEAIGVDGDADALANARANVARNGVADRVDLQRERVDEAWLGRLDPGRANLIVANVSSGVIVPLLPAFRRAVGSRGRVLVGGILESEAGPVVDAARDARLRTAAEDREDGWWTGWLEALDSPAQRDAPFDEPVRGDRP